MQTKIEAFERDHGILFFDGIRWARAPWAHLKGPGHAEGRVHVSEALGRGATVVQEVASKIISFLDSYLQELLFCRGCGCVVVVVVKVVFVVLQVVVLWWLL